MVSRGRWFYETLYPDLKLGILTKKPLAKGRSSLQGIQIADTYRFGRILALDGVIQTTEKDEFIYHEMMTHVPLLSCRNPEDILVIGGGDGGILRETIKHPVNKVVLVEIDQKVIDFCRRMLPTISRGAFSNEKVQIVIDDGAKYVETTDHRFDVVIVDSTDPIGPSRELFRKRFYTNVSRILKRGGIMVRQSGSTVVQKNELRDTYRTLKQIFRYVAVYLIAVPTYVGGFFSITFASNFVDPLRLSVTSIKNRYKKLNLKTRYYNPELHCASFVLPEYVKEILR